MSDRRTWIWLCLTACGRLHFDPADEAGLDAASDAFDPAVVPWRTPAHQLTELDVGAADDDPSITADRLTIVWSSNRGGGLGGNDLWTATRADPGAPFTTVTNLGSLNTASGEFSPEISPDGSAMFFVSDRTGLGDVYAATRSGTAWNAPSLVTELSMPPAEQDLALTPDFLTALVASGTRFYRATRPDLVSPFGAAVEVPELRIDTTIASPTIGDGARVVYFHAGPGADRDIFVARLQGSTYTTPALVTELHTLGRDADPFILGDETYLIYNCASSLCETFKP